MPSPGWAEARRQVQGLDTEALPKFGKEKEAASLSGALPCAVSRNPDICGTGTQRTLRRGRVMLLLLAPAGLADAADDTWGGEE